MSLIWYQRVRAVFARAVELAPAERARFLDEACGGDPALRREVDSLLEHHFADSIVKEPGPRARVVPQEGASATGSRPNLFSRRRYRRAVILTSGLGLVLLGWWTHARIDTALQRMRSGQLETLLASKTAAFEAWVRAEQSQLRILARDAEFRGPALELIRIAEAGRAAIPALKSSPAREALVDYLMPAKDDLGYRDLEIYDARGLLVFAASRQPQAGGQLNRNGLAVLAKVLAGESIFEKPYRVGTMFIGSEGGGTIYTVVGVPVRGDDGRVEGGLAATRRAYEAFADIIAARFGETGEVYAFDRRALMLTPSPLAQEFREEGLLPAPADPSRGSDVDTQLNLRLQDPGRRLSPDAPVSAEGTPLPLTRLASTALARGPVDDATTVILEPYRNYRGAEVIGAWRWLPEYDLVLAAEMETAEAFAPLWHLNTTMGILLGLLVLSVGGGLLATFRVARLRGRLHQLTQLGQYRLLEPIGEGGMGKVYLAEHAALKRPTAIKILSAELRSAEAVARFEREVTVSSRLTHPNTIEIYDYGQTDDGVLYYAMEYVDGLNLAQLVSRYGPVPAGRAIHLLTQVCGSLKEAHVKGVVHRDIKPMNVMVCCRGGLSDVVKVLDFGLAKLSEGRDTELTKATHVGGTLMYMAPERLTSPRSVDARADIYSLGGVAYYLLTGRPPFESANDLDLVHQLANVRPRRPSDVVDAWIPVDLDRLVTECLEKSPDRRPASIDQVERRLRAIAGEVDWTEDDASRWWREREAQRMSA